MHNVVLPHEVKRNQDLDRKSLDQAQLEALEVVHLYEVVKVHTQKFERYHQVLTKYELVKLLYNIFLILRVFLIKLLNKLRFD